MATVTKSQQSRVEGVFFLFWLSNASFPAPTLLAPNRKYNFLDAGEGRGDELYGVEPASYYLKNLFLNTSLAFPLAVALPFLALLLYPMADKVKGDCFRGVS